MEKSGARVVTMEELLADNVSIEKDSDGIEVEVIGDKDTTAQKEKDLEAKAAAEEAAKKAEEEAKKAEEGEDETIDPTDLGFSVEKPEDKKPEEDAEEGKDLDGDVKPEDKKPETVEATDEDEKRSERYRSSLKKLFGDDFTVSQEVEGGEFKDFKVDELILDEEHYTWIVENTVKQKEAALKEGMISKDGLSEFASNLIEVEKSGGDVQSLVQVKESVTDKINKADLSTKEGQREVLMIRYTMKGKTPDEAKRLIRTYEQDGELEAAAEAADSELREAVRKHAEDVKAKAKADKLEREQKMKEYRKSIKDTIDTQEFSEQAKKNLKKAATELAENGVDFKIDEKYYEAMRDPEMAMKITMLLTNEDMFKKYLTNAAVQEAKLEKAPKFRIPIKSSGTTVSEKNKRNPGEGPDAISVEELTGFKG